MSCRLYATLLSDALDDAITHDEERLLEAHLALCRACSELRDDLAGMRLLLREDGPALRESAADSDERLFERIDQREREPLASVWSLVRSVLPPPGLVSSSAFAAALVLSLGILASGTGPGTTPGPAPRVAAVSPTAAVPSFPAVEALRDSGVLTVWDSSGDRIVATVDPEGQAQADLVQRASLGTDGRAEALAQEPLTKVHQVRMVLFQRIIVKG